MQCRHWLAASSTLGIGRHPSRMSKLMGARHASPGFQCDLLDQDPVPRIQDPGSRHPGPRVLDSGSSVLGPGPVSWIVDLVSRVQVQLAELAFVLPIRGWEFEAKGLDGIT